MDKENNAKSMDDIAADKGLEKEDAIQPVSDKEAEGAAGGLLGPNLKSRGCGHFLGLPKGSERS